MNRNTKLKSLADTGRLYALPDPAPKSCIQQDHVNGSVQNVCRQLLEIYNHCVGRKRYPNLFACSPHSAHAKNRIFKVVVFDFFNLPAEPNCLLGRPNAVRIEPEPVGVQRLGHRSVTFQFILRYKNTAFQFMRGEAVFSL